MEIDQQINKLLQKAEINKETKVLLAEFLMSIKNEPQFSKILDLLNRFPSVFDNFCKNFESKKNFYEKGGSEEEWQNIKEKETNIFN